MKFSKTILLPIACSVLFIFLYAVAASFYPGGNYENRTAKGFDWAHNYWCNLLNDTALNGEVNNAKPFAIAAMGVLALGLLSFWIICSKLMYKQKLVRLIMQLSGLFSIAVLFYLSGKFHDVVINISGGFGLIAMAGAYVGIYKKRWYALFAFGIINLLLIAANNYIYHTENWFYYLAVIQKITFLSCLLWICLVNIRLYKLTAAS